MADSMDKAQLKLTAADLTVQLAELKIKLAELLEENAALKTAARRATAPAEVEIRDGVYFRTGSDDGPFCTGCYDQHGKLIRLGPMPAFAVSDLGKYRCPVCHAHFR